MFEKGDILKLKNDPNKQFEDLWLVIDLMTDMNSNGCMQNEYVLLHKHGDIYSINYVHRKLAEDLFIVVGKWEVVDPDSGSWIITGEKKE